MGVQLYTVRVVLEALGASDYGINNVVGGVVYMFSFLSATMATASQRYFAFEIGRGDQFQLRKTFSMTLLIYCLISIIIFFLLETLGVWFLGAKINIPVNRIAAANWVYQFAVVSFFLTMFQVPYNALVIAYERMNFFAYVGVLEAVLKLSVAYLLTTGSYDKLVLYAALNLGVTFLVAAISIIYCLTNFKESRFKYYWNKSLFYEITSYSGWNLFGSLAALMNNQGVNIVLNMFFGPIVNAARAIAFQINTALNLFVQNFMTATRPQITKYHAQGDNEKMVDLVYRSSKFSFFLLFLVSLPIMFEMPFILKIWLNEVPEYTILFARIIIVTTMFDCLSYSIQAAFQATGKIKLYQTIVGIMVILNIPISYFLFKSNFPPQAALYVIFCNVVLCLFIRLALLKKLILELSIKRYISKVLRPIFIVACLVGLAVYISTSLLQESFIRLCVTGIVSVFLTTITIVVFGTDREERAMVNEIIFKKINR